MKIVSLTAENVKRLKAVEITPDGNVVTITGRNAQGKTSVLDAIWLALGGGPAQKGTSKPIRDGEDHASVTLDLGDVVVTRTWKGDKTALTVTAADGAKYSSPQGVLDALVGRLSFDPLEFTRLSARDQKAALLDLVDLGVDLDALDADRKRFFDERTEVGRQGKAIGAVVVDESLPTEPVSATAILSQIREAQDAERRASEARLRVARASDSVSRLTAQIAALTEDLDRTALDHVQAVSIVAALPPLPDIATLESDLATVEQTNDAIRSNNEARAQSERKAALRAEYDALTAKVAAVDAAKAEALAGATFPIDGLAFDESGVTYQGVPFSQASSAEQIRVSLAMAMSLNPKLRVIRILDGSLLDADNLALIAEAAVAADYQVWIERVSDPSETAVVIEDGEVA